MLVYKRRQLSRSQLLEINMSGSKHCFMIFLVFSILTVAPIQDVVSQSRLPHNPGDRFATIAYSKSDGYWGYSYEFNSERKANREALNYCRNAGGRSCRVVMRVANGCGAVARTNRTSQYYASTGKRKATALSNALNKCKKNTGKQCSVIVWACTSG